jgi:hypothetical protein
MYRTPYPTDAAHTLFFFQWMHKAFSRVYHILGHQTSLNKHKEVEIYQVSNCMH